MMKFTTALLAALVAMAATSAVVADAACRLHFRSRLRTDTVRLCGRANGGVPGAWFSHALRPGETFSRPCAVTAAGKSFETYFSFRNDTRCGWDGPCAPNTGTCRSYPWTLGQGLSSDNGLWYGFIAANFDGAIGYQGSSYGNRSMVSYGVRLDCMSYGTAPWNATCGVAANRKGPTCQPNVPSLGFPDSGVVACGPKNNQAMFVTVIEQ